MFIESFPIPSLCFLSYLSRFYPFIPFVYFIIIPFSLIGLSSHFLFLMVSLLFSFLYFLFFSSSFFVYSLFCSSFLVIKSSMSLSSNVNNPLCQSICTRHVSFLYSVLYSLFFSFSVFVYSLSFLLLFHRYQIVYYVLGLKRKRSYMSIKILPSLPTPSLPSSFPGISITSSGHYFFMAPRLTFQRST